MILEARKNSLRKGKQAHHRIAVLELVRVMKLYSKNTKISITARGDAQEIFECSLPTPHNYSRNGNEYTLEYIINGYFGTNKSYTYLNDIIARFTLSMKVLDTKISSSNDDGIELSSFQGLKSIVRHKNYERVDIGQDNIFYAIKYYIEDLIRESGEGNIIAYSLVESFAFARFIDRAKDKSTLKAKCRSIWNWYEARGWTIPKRKGLGMNRTENAKRVSKMKAEATKKAVQKAVAGLEFMQEKVNIANVARDAKVSRNTAKKYLIELGYITTK